METMSELVALYNKHNPEKPVKKFTDRATAKRRCQPYLKKTGRDDLGTLIAETWKDPEVRAARCERSAVLVDKKEYKSVGAAFKALKLPGNKVIRFRMRLKEEIKLTEYGHKWEIVPLNY